MERRSYSELSPKELNGEFHRLLGLVSANQLSIVGAPMEETFLEMTEAELSFYRARLEELRQGYGGMTLEEIDASLDDSTRELYVGIAKGDAARERRMTFGATLLVKLGEFTPFVKGTDSFKQAIRREMTRLIGDGISMGGKDHWLYGNEIGGIFHPMAVEAIEEKSFQMLGSDIGWYGMDPLMIMGRLFEADYDNDSVYREMVDLGRKWKTEFTERYKRVPLDVRGQEIQIP